MEITDTEVDDDLESNDAPFVYHDDVLEYLVIGFCALHSSIY